MRIYYPHALQAGQIIDLEKNAAHHVGRVLRARCGDAIGLFDGHGNEYQGSITALHKHHVEVTLANALNHTTESPYALHLGQALLMREKMDWVIQKAVELGAASITPIITARSQPRLPAERYAKRQQHWEHIIIHACEQSGRSQLPILHSPCDISQWVAQHAGIVCAPTASMTIRELPSTTVSSMPVLIGPEGGLTSEEIAQAEQHHWQSVKLGPRVLRTETAAIAMLAILQAQFGDV